MTSATTQEVLEQTLAQLKYKKVYQTASAILEAATKYSKLKYEPNYYSFNNGIQKQLMTLTGTVPISYEGSFHNIPMLVWIPITYPTEAPTFFIMPTEKMPIKQNNSYYILLDGFVSLRSLFPLGIIFGKESTILKILDGLTAAFNEVPPVQFIVTKKGEKGLESPQAQCLQIPLPYDVPINEEDLVETFISYQYTRVEQYATAILEVTQKFNLKPVLDNFVFNNGVQETLLTLTGTLPIQRGKLMGNIPIVIWFPNSRNRPDRIKIFVKPTEKIKIACGDFDYNIHGEVVYGPCMSLLEYALRIPHLYLVNLITVLIEMFCKCCPVRFESLKYSQKVKKIRGETCEQFTADLQKALTAGPVQKTLESERVIALASRKKGKGVAQVDVTAIPAAVGGLREDADADSDSDSSGSFESVADFLIEAGGGVPVGDYSNSGSLQTVPRVEHEDEVIRNTLDFIIEELSSLETGSESVSTSTAIRTSTLGTNKVKVKKGTAYPSETSRDDVVAQVPIPQRSMSGDNVEACMSHGNETDNGKMVLRSGKVAQNYTTFSKRRSK